jgi:hypothetical protein
MLGACHERVQRTLDLLQRLQTYLAEQGVDDSARQAARDVLRYFDVAAPLHHEDEELHIFPPLLQPGTDAGTQAVVRQLQRDHVAMAACWAQARVPLQALAGGVQQAFRRRTRRCCSALRVCMPTTSGTRKGRSTPRPGSWWTRRASRPWGVKWRRGAGAEPRRAGSALMHMRQGRDRVLWF